jgi:hypothetical protein
MPIKTVCPECDRAYTLADAMEGKSVKCKGCGQAFTVEAAGGPTGIAAKPSGGKLKAVRPANDDADEVLPARAKKKGGGGAGKVLLIGGALVAVLALFVCGGVGVGGFLLYHYWNSSDDSSTASSTADKDKSNADKSNADKSNADKSNADKSNADKSKTDKDKQPPPQSKVTKANFDQLKNGMTQAQVENILGPSTGGFWTGGRTASTPGPTSRTSSP